MVMMTRNAAERFMDGVCDSDPKNNGWRYAYAIPYSNRKID